MGKSVKTISFNGCGRLSGLQYLNLTDMKGKRARLIKKYLAKDDRVGQKITQIVKLFHEKPAHQVLNTFIEKPLQAVTAFKYLVLLHSLLHEQAISRSLCSNILKGISLNTQKDFDVIMWQKYVNPYRLFLQKRCQLDLKAKPESEEELEVLIFQMFNIIKTASTFQHIIYIFGRYFINKYLFIIDFNIILAKDITNIYDNLQRKIHPPYSPHFLREVELIHETMYPIYYNNYFFIHLKPFKPMWIDTQPIQNIHSTPKKYLPKRADLETTAVSSQHHSIDAKSVQLPQINEDSEYIVNNFELDEQIEAEQTKEQLLSKPFHIELTQQIQQ